MTNIALKMVRAVRDTDHAHQPKVVNDKVPNDPILACSCSPNVSYPVPAFMAHMDIMAANAIDALLEEHDQAVVKRACGAIITNDDVWEHANPHVKKEIGKALNQAMALATDEAKPKTVADVLNDLHFDGQPVINRESIARLNSNGLTT